MKVRNNLRLEEDVAKWLEGLASEPGSTKSAIVNAALRHYRSRKAGNEIDDLLKHRLDRMSHSLGRIERDIQIVMETQALFILYQFQVTAPLPEGDAAARAIAADRYNAFIDQVGRRIARAKEDVSALEAPTQSRTAESENDRSFH